MLNRSRAAATLLGVVCVSILAGCSSGKETAVVSFSYVLEPTKGLPPGMKTIIINPAKVGPATDPKWSDLSATVLRSLVEESASEFGTEITVADRRDTQATFDEADLAAAGMSTRQGGGGGQLLAAEGAILSNINVKVETHKGKKRTLTDLSAYGGWRHGGGSAHTEEVETVTRNMTVQTEFKLLDTANNKVWVYHSPKTYRATERTKASPIFGSSKTEAELTPRDAIIATLVERGAREFISKLMPCRIEVEAEIKSSSNENCIQGVRLLRAEEYEMAIEEFKSALAMDATDDRAAFGAGLALEATGKYADALKYYKKALIGDDDQAYKAAKDRVKLYSGRTKS